VLKIETQGNHAKPNAENAGSENQMSKSQKEYCLYTETTEFGFQVHVTAPHIDECYDKLDSTDIDWDGVMLGEIVDGIVVPVEVE